MSAGGDPLPVSVNELVFVASSSFVEAAEDKPTGEGDVAVTGFGRGGTGGMEGVAGDAG